ncbi:hypothetical protein ACI01nite_14300 [Acetobacter cibinongensis]|uniref:Uncharacterized protein n=1 Tax=Acetobacter cibinongensis TaxID=146475 RepID=A0A0D6N470_9PROT|nr:hypothetical protein Abci_016_143 [Acetobacter cibinongensis]GBQ12205.1 hypothetical protein AA0482_0182 [Acetobacter cibinongensis NRIC 0482]GEL58828.1 hypothetical protein ACI01nite_14300 [Acetobacter cibinongensis]
MRPSNVYIINGGLQYGNIFLNREKMRTNFINNIDKIKKEEWEIYP